MKLVLGEIIVWSVIGQIPIKAKIKKETVFLKFVLDE